MDGAFPGTALPSTWTSLFPPARRAICSAKLTQAHAFCASHIARLSIRPGNKHAQQPGRHITTMKEGASPSVPSYPNDYITPGKGISQKAGQRIDSVHGQTGTTEAKQRQWGPLCSTAVPMLRRTAQQNVWSRRTERTLAVAVPCRRTLPARAHVPPGPA